MKTRTATFLSVLFFSCVMIEIVSAAEEGYVDKFLGSPLLILVAVLIIVGIAFVYHKIRK